jgi:hypothetical protein
MCIIGLLFLPMANIFLYNRPLGESAKDFMREATKKAEHTDYSSSDISTFVNDYFIFYIPPAINRELEYTRAYEAKSYGYVVANLSTIQLFSYENGAEIEVEWLNGTAISGATFNHNREEWDVDSSSASIVWFDELTVEKVLKRTIKLGEYETEEIQLNDWIVAYDYRILSGVVKITSDNPISVMHHKMYKTGTVDEDGYDMVNYRWDGVYSAYGKKLFTRIAGDCWISALEANTEVNVWDYSDKNDDESFKLDRFEGWAYSRNAIFEQFGFDDDLVLISADKPVSIVAGLQADQGFVQVFGKDGRDFMFPCFGYILIHAPNGASNIELKDKSGNQGSFSGSLGKDEIKFFDFKVAYKQRYYSSFEWAELRSSDPIMVYTFANNTWYLDDEYYGLMSGEEYINSYKKITEFYPHGVVPYPADTEFKIPLRSRAYITIVNLDHPGNTVKVDFNKVHIPLKKDMSSYQAITLDYSKDGYYPTDLEVEATGFVQKEFWSDIDPENRYAVESTYRVVIDEEKAPPFRTKLSWTNITRGSTVKIKADKPILVFINYDNYNRYTDPLNRWQSNFPQGIDLIPGLTPPSMRGLPDVPALIVIISGIIIAVDMILVTVGRTPIIDLFKK